MEYVVAWLCTAVVFFAIDFIWLARVAKTFYRSRIGHLMADRIGTGAAMAFYVLYIAGIVFFAVGPALATGLWTTAAINGALFGFFCYATYDITNYATLRGWPAAVVVTDITWGVALTGTSSVAGFALTRLFI